jgi:hypothetical protein
VFEHGNKENYYEEVSSSAFAVLFSSNLNALFGECRIPTVMKFNTNVVWVILYLVNILYLFSTEVYYFAEDYFPLP